MEAATSVPAPHRRTATRNSLNGERAGARQAFSLRRVCSLTGGAWVLRRTSSCFLPRLWCTSESSSTSASCLKIGRDRPNQEDTSKEQMANSKRRDRSSRTNQSRQPQSQGQDSPSANAKRDESG